MTSNLALSRPLKYKNWKEEHLFLACEAVKQGMSLRQAEEEYGIPKSTIQDRVSGKILFGSRSGPTPYLNDAEEEELAMFLEGSASIGYPYTRKKVIALVQKVVDEKGRNVVSVIRKAAEEQVVVFCLPPHTTHETQPLDKGPFSPLKSYWREACRQFLHDNPGKVISRFTFSKVFGKVWGKVMCMENIISGFRCTGLYPVDRNKLIVKNEMPKKSTLAECTRVNFIPLFSPHCRSTVNDTMFTPDEHIIYQKRYDEGYDLQTDTKYNKWKSMYHPDNVDPCPDPDPSSDPNSFPDIPYSPDCLPDSLLDDHQQQTTDPSSMHLNPTDPSFDSTGTQLYTDQQLLYSTNPQYSHPYPSYSFDQMCAADPLISQWYPHISFPNPQNSQNVYDPCWFWNRPFQAVPVQMPRNIPPLQPSSKENLPNQLSQSTVLSKFISEKLPVTKLPSLAPKTSAKVLT